MGLAPSHLAATSALTAMLEEPPLRSIKVRVLGRVLFEVSDRITLLMPVLSKLFEGQPYSSTGVSDLARRLLERHCPLELHFADPESEVLLTHQGCQSLTSYLLSDSGQ